MLQRRVSACFLERQRREAEERRNKKAIPPVVIKENCKICLLGDKKVGKSTLTNMWVGGPFQDEENHNDFIGTDIKEITKEFKDNTVNITIYDCDSEEKFKSLNRVFLKKSDIIVFMFAYDNKESFENLNNLIEFYDLKEFKNKFC